MIVLENVVLAKQFLQKDCYFYINASVCKGARNENYICIQIKICNQT